MSIGKGVEIWKGARLEVVASEEQDGPMLVIGDGTIIHMYFHCGAAKSLVIGSRVLIAGRVYISDHDHIFDDPTVPPIRSGLRVAPVVIEDEVWIGEGAAILKGVRVGKRSVVGANAVVTRNVPAYSVVGGNPARVIKSFNPENS
jgi:lipopolysaccharide O-acetyltransferase